MEEGQVEPGSNQWKALFQVVESAKTTLQDKIEKLQQEEDKVREFAAKIEETKSNMAEQARQMNADLRYKTEQLRAILDKYQKDMESLINNDYQWMTKSLDQLKSETDSEITRTDEGVAALQREIIEADKDNARETVEKLERSVDSMSQNLKLLPRNLPAFVDKPFPCQAEVLSSVVALDYQWSPWNLLVLSDSSDDYKNADWVGSFVSALLKRLDPAKAQQIIEEYNQGKEAS